MRNSAVCSCASARAPHGFRPAASPSYSPTSRWRPGDGSVDKLRCFFAKMMRIEDEKWWEMRKFSCRSNLDLASKQTLVTRVIRWTCWGGERCWLTRAFTARAHLHQQAGSTQVRHENVQKLETLMSDLLLEWGTLQKGSCVKSFCMHCPLKASNLHRHVQCTARSLSSRDICVVHRTDISTNRKVLWTYAFVNGWHDFKGNAFCSNLGKHTHAIFFWSYCT